MLEKLQALEDKYNEINEKLSDPKVIADQAAYRKYTKAHADLTELVQTYQEYKSVQQGIADSKALLEDELDKEMEELVWAELEELEANKEELEGRLKILLLPKDPNDDKSVIFEIRAGTGGDEAALFAGDLYRMYSRYAERMRWKVEVMSASPTDIGGFKEVIFVVDGHGAYSQLKYESGVHRVQRIPSTESGGRIHTSTSTVAVLPEAEEVDVEINPNELQVDVFRSSGPGGQSVNTTDSAVRITHLPTGLVVSCQDEKSQLKNKEKALRILRARLLDQIQEKQQAEIAENRKSQVGTGDRSERIRTYNFPQGRITDHRVGLTLYKLEQILDGELTEIIDALITTDQSEKLKQVE
jgi:peptide chain release factor 1